jgi:NAD(P)-dependent dehydrogenase (short-subunit alcohol dehydrogenase family)
VNNAGFVRDRMFANAAEDEWDAVVRVHLKGHFCVGRFAAAYWRDKAKTGEPVDARIINTSSGAGLLGSVGQAAYSSAKAGIATLTLVQSAELGRYGVTANAIAPSARTRMTETVFADMMAVPDEPAAFDAMAPENIAPLVVWLGSTESRDVTGRVFEVEGGKVSIADGWQHGPSVDKGDRWEPAELGAVVADLLAKSPPPAPVYGAS